MNLGDFLAAILMLGFSYLMQYRIFIVLLERLELPTATDIPAILLLLSIMNSFQVISLILLLHRRRN